MSEASTPAGRKQNFLERHHFVLRRLHSLTGIIPIGAFLVVHLITNASIVWGWINEAAREQGHAGVVTYQHEVNFIHSLPALILLEIFGLWLPIAFHSILGVIYAAQGRWNTGEYKYQANWRYVLQRVSGYVGVVFIFYHVATLRWGWTFLIPGGTHWDAKFSASTLAAALQGSTEGITAAGFAVAAFYMAGVTLLVFHLANGLWTAAITWGITVSNAAQRRWGYVCAGIGAGLMALAWAAVIGFATLDYDGARATEERMVHSAQTPPEGPIEAGETPGDELTGER